MAWGGNLFDAATLRLHWQTTTSTYSAFAGDGKFLVAADAVWDLTRPQPVLQAPIKPGGPKTVAASPKGSRLAAYYRDGTIRLWDWQDGKLKEREGMKSHPGEHLSLFFLGDNKTMASYGPGGLVCWDLSASKPTEKFALKGAAGLAFSPDGKWLAHFEHNAADNPVGVILWDVTGNFSFPLKS